LCEPSREGNPFSLIETAGAAYVPTAFCRDVCALAGGRRHWKLLHIRTTDPSPGPLPDEVHRDSGPPSPRGRGQLIHF
jgi:hypothetical protein